MTIINGTGCGLWIKESDSGEMSFVDQDGKELPFRSGINDLLGLRYTINRLLERRLREKEEA